MGLLGSLMNPRGTIRRFKSTYSLGRRMLQLQSLPFHSGLGDSAWILYGLVRTLKPDVCVEIGSARGKSACYIGRALVDNGKGRLYAIDPHAKTDWNDSNSVDTFQAMQSNMESVGVKAYVEILRETSERAAQGWSRSIDLIFIDGDHSYEGVKRDWTLFIPHVTPFGLVVFHDTAWEIDPVSWREYAREDMGVPRFVEELRHAGYPIITFPKDCGLSIVQAQIGGISLREPPQSRAIHAGL